MDDGDFKIPVREEGSVDEVVSSEMLLFVPTIILLAAIFIFGSIGNGLVFYVYKTRYPNSNTRMFILFLSGLDFFACVIAVPVHILTIPNQYRLYSPIVCKGSGFLDAVGTVGSLFILISIAFERFKKICRPLSRQLSLKVVIVLCSISVTLGLMIALSNLFIYGRKTVHLSKYPIPLVECSVADNMKESFLPIITFVVYGLLFLVTAVLITAFYFCAVRAIYRQMDKMYVFSSSRSTSQNEISTIRVSTDENRKRSVSRSWSLNKIRERRGSYSSWRDDTQTSSNKDVKITNDMANSSVTEVKEMDSTEILGNDQKHSEPNQKVFSLDVKRLQKDEETLNQPPNMTSSTNKIIENDRKCRPTNSLIFPSTSDISRDQNTTRSNVLLRKVSPSSISSQQTLRTAGRRSVLMMLAVSLTFATCYIPVIALLVLRNVDKDLVYKLSDVQYVFYKLFLRSYFVNFAANPFIYGICDRRFRLISKGLFCRCRENDNVIDD